MKVLIYKRTHKGDPGPEGIFGIQDCMGRVRNWNYDAVIGIGGSSPWKQDADIKHKINWVGVEPKRITPSKRGDRIVFEYFALYEEKGLNIQEHYPNLFEYMYVTRKRFDMSPDLPENVFKEVNEILNSVKDGTHSGSYNAFECRNDVVFDNNFASTKCRGCFENKEVEITIHEC